MVLDPREIEDVRKTEGAKRGNMELIIFEF
jgi:hypothetical protein